MRIEGRNELFERSYFVETRFVVDIG